MPNTYYSNSQWRVEAVGWDATWPRVFTRYMEVNMAYGGGHCIWRGASNSKISTERQLGRVDVGRGHPKKVLAPGHSQMGTPLPTAVSALWQPLPLFSDPFIRQWRNKKESVRQTKELNILKKIPLCTRVWHCWSQVTFWSEKNTLRERKPSVVIDNVLPENIPQLTARQRTTVLMVPSASLSPCIPILTQRPRAAQPVWIF